MPVLGNALPDHALMEALRGGDFGAFQTLYDRHHRAVFTFLLRSVGDRGTAEDLLQETFLRVFTHREEYRPTAAFRTWLFTIARNLIVDEVRKPARGVERQPGEVGALPDPGPTPLQHAEAGRLQAKLEAAVLALPPAQREVLLLSRFAGLGHAEIADITGSSPAAVRVALHRALRRLRELLGPL